MSRMRKISLMNDFIFSLSTEMQDRIENFVDGNYSLDDDRILEEFGLTVQFEEYVNAQAA